METPHEPLKIQFENETDRDLREVHESVELSQNISRNFKKVDNKVEVSNPIEDPPVKKDE